MMRANPWAVLCAFATAAWVVPAAAENAVTASPASVRAGPDNSYPEVAQLDTDTPLQVMGCLDDWSWCDVEFGGARGWLYAPVISYQYQGGYVPFYSYAPGLGVAVVSFSIGTYWGSYYHDRPWYAQREEWVRRGPPHHQRPPGPPPHAGPPPPEALVRNSHPDPHSGRPVHLSNADPVHHDNSHNAHHDGDRHDVAGGSPNPSGSARPPDRRAPPPPPKFEAQSRPVDPHANGAATHARPPEHANGGEPHGGKPPEHAQAHPAPPAEHEPPHEQKPN